MMNFFYLLRDAWADRAKLGDGAVQKSLAEFMPAALELQETPPNPIARLLGKALIILFILVVLWACFGKIDVVASSEGKIIPSSRVKQIQPLTKGFIKNIHVREGQYVHQGDPLIELDQTLTKADKVRMQYELRNASLNLAGVEFLQKMMINNTESNQIKASNQIQLHISHEILATEEELILYQQKTWEQWQQYQAQLSGLKSSLLKAESEKSASQETIKKLEKILPMITKRAAALEVLYTKKMVSESEYLEIEQQRIEQVQDLATQQQTQQQINATITEIEQRINELKADTKSKLLMQIAEIRHQLTTTNEELKKATDINDKQILYAPVSGYIQQLSVNTIGGVVTEAQQLMIVVPEEEGLEIQALLSNQDIGFVNKGMSAEVKIHTFPFTKYGLIDAIVTDISEDAIIDEKLGLVYEMHLKMKENSIRVENKDVKLMPGMAVTAEVKTTQRRVIEYFLSPLLRHTQESIRER